ncbi:MAG: hypothetical protein IKJ78_06740 [Bacteroidales bacterium]|nr:hypothetical protein [Bacteroidales bacterium]
MNITKKLLLKYTSFSLLLRIAIGLTIGAVLGLTLPGWTGIGILGLALGLSSLSSRNISFDDLFIDEGFGTLDPDTLATVIDSLAVLQSSQGKKVGVISHTNTMSERITTQIRLIPQGNTGSSHIEIVPR